MANAYSLLPAKNVISYQDGVEQGHDKLPAKAQKKLDKGKSLTAMEELLQRGLELIKKDSDLPSDRRQSWIFDFEEEWEEDDEEEEEEEEEEIVEKPPPKKKKKTKTSKKKKNVAKDDFIVDEEEEEEETKEKLITKKQGKRKRQSEEDKSEGTKSSKKKKSSKKSKKSKQLDDEIEEEVMQEEHFFQEEELPSEDDKNDDDFSVESERSESEDDDEDDENYEEKSAKPKTKRLKKAKEAKEIKSKKKENDDVSTKSKKPTKKKSTQKLLQLEQQLFEECEDIFLPFMNKLRREDLLLKSVEKQLNGILKQVTKLTPAFIQHYQIGLLVKEVRNQYKDNENLNKLCKKITSNMKAVYKEKVGSQPKGFQPKLTKTLSEKVRSVSISNIVALEFTSNSYDECV